MHCDEHYLDTLSLRFVVHVHVLPTPLRFVAAYVALGHQWMVTLVQRRKRATMNTFDPEQRKAEEKAAKEARMQ